MVVLVEVSILQHDRMARRNETISSDAGITVPAHMVLITAVIAVCVAV